MAFADDAFIPVLRIPETLKRGSPQGMSGNPHVPGAYLRFANSVILIKFLNFADLNPGTAQIYG